MSDVAQELAEFQRNHIPGTVIKDGQMFVDGTPVMEWQLTPEELKIVNPARYTQLYGLGNVVCPLCGTEVDAKTRAGITTHVRNKHPEVFKAKSERMKATESVEGILALLKETENG